MTPRQVGFLLQEGAALDARRQMVMLGIVRGKDASKLQSELRSVAFPRPPAQVPFEAGLVALAEKVGDRKAARRMKIRAVAMRFAAAKSEGGPANA